MANSVKVKIDGDTSGFESKLGSIGNIAKRGLGLAAKTVGAVSTALIGAGAAAFKFGSEYETSLTKVSTIADTSKVSIEQLSDGILELSNKTGRAATDLNEALYQAISASVDTADAVDFVATATKLAGGGFTDVTSAVDVLSTVINAYGMSAEDATHISDVLIQTQNKGKTTVDELASSLGKVIPTANAFGVSLEQLGASYSILTSKGISTRIATTYLNSMLNELGKSGTTASTALKSLTGKTFTEFMQSGGTLAEAIEKLKSKADASGLSLADMFGSAEAGKAAMTLASEGVEGFKEQLDGMINSEGNTEKASAKMANTAQKSVAKIANSFKNLGIEIYQSAEGPIAEALAKIASYAQELTDSFKRGGFTELAHTFGEVVGEMAGDIANALPDIIDMAVTIINEISTALGAHAQEIGAAAGRLVAALVDGMLKFLPQIVAVGAQIARELLFGILKELPTIIKTITSNFGLLGTALLAAFSVVKVVGAINTIKKSLSALKISIDAVTAGTKAAGLSAQLAATMGPAALALAIGVAAVETGKFIYSLTDAGKASKAFHDELDDTIQSVNSLREAREKVTESSNEQLGADLAEINRIQTLSNELDGLVDANGNVTDANRNHAQFILNELNSALGTEYQLVGNQIEHYKELKKAIDDTLASKRLAAYDTALSEGYGEAIKKEADARATATQALNDYTQAQQRLEEAKQTASKLDDALAVADYVKAQEAWVQAQQELQALLQTQQEYEQFQILSNTQGAEAAIAYAQAITNAHAAANAAIQSDTATLSAGLDQSQMNLESALIALSAVFQNYDGSEAANAAVQNMLQQFLSSESEFEAAGHTLADGIIQGANGDVDMSTIIENIKSAFEGMGPEGEALGQQFIEALASGAAANEETFVSATDSAVEAAASSAESKGQTYFGQLGQFLGAMFGTSASAAGIESGTQAGADMANAVANGVNANSAAVTASVAQLSAGVGLAVPQFTTAGGNLMTGLGSGIDGGASGVSNSATTAVNGAQNAANGAAGGFNSVGLYIAQGTAAGVDAGSGAVAAACTRMVQNALAAAQAAAVIKSPSHVFRDEVGWFIGLGVAAGIDNSIERVKQSIVNLVDTAKEIGKKAIDNLYSELEKQAEDGIGTVLFYTDDKAKSDAIHEAQIFSDAIRNAQDTAAFKKAVEDRAKYLQSQSKDSNKKFDDFLKEAVQDANKILDEAAKDEKNRLENIKEWQKEAQKAFDDNWDAAEDKLDEFTKKVGKFNQNLKKQFDYTQKITKTLGADALGRGGTEYDAYELGDIKAYNEGLKYTFANLDKLKNAVPAEIYDYVKDLAATDMLGANRFMNAFFAMSDADKQQWLADWQETNELRSQITEQTFADEGATLYDELTAEFGQLPEDFLGLGELSAEKFGDGFKEKVAAAMAGAKETIAAAFASILPAAAFTGGGVGGGNTTTYNDNRSTTINAGTSASAAEIAEANRQAGIYQEHTGGFN